MAGYSNNTTYCLVITQVVSSRIDYVSSSRVQLPKSESELSEVHPPPGVYCRANSFLWHVGLLGLLPPFHPSFLPFDSLHFPIMAFESLSARHKAQP